MIRHPAKYPSYLSDASHSSHPLRAFTLVEMLVVITIIGIIAAMVLSLTGLASRKKHDALVNAQKNKLTLLISAYYSKMGYYPLDNANNVLFPAGSQAYELSTATNSLLYELTGATYFVTNAAPAFLTFDSQVLPASAVIALIGRGGIANSNPDEPRNFFKPYPNPNDYTNYGLSPMKGLLVPVPTTNSLAPNFWHYDSSSTNRHNATSYDLWAEYAAGRDSAGNFITITNGNW